MNWNDPGVRWLICLGAIVLLIAVLLLIAIFTGGAR